MCGSPSWAGRTGGAAHYCLSPGHGPFHPPGTSSTLLTRNSSEKYSRRPCPHTPRAGWHRPAPVPAGYAHPLAGLMQGQDGAGTGSAREGTGQGGFWHGAAPQHLWFTLPAPTGAGLGAVGLDEGFGVGGQKRGYMGAWGGALHRLHPPWALRAGGRKGMGSRQLPLSRSSHPPQVSPRCLHPSGGCLSLGEWPPASPGGAPFAWRVGRGDRRRWGAGTGWHSSREGGVPACPGGISLTTLSTCALGSWASSWGSGKPVRIPQTARRCPGPCQERGATQSRAPPAPSAAAMRPTWGTPSPHQHPTPCPRDAHPAPSGAVLVPTPLCMALPDGGKAVTCHAPPFWGWMVPVVLRGVLVRQHLQVDGLGSPLDAPVLQGRQVPMGEPWGPGTHRGTSVLLSAGGLGQ